MSYLIYEEPRVNVVRQDLHTGYKHCTVRTHNIAKSNTRDEGQHHLQLLRLLHKAGFILAIHPSVQLYMVITTSFVQELNQQLITNMAYVQIYHALGTQVLSQPPAGATMVQYGVLDLAHDFSTAEVHNGIQADYTGSRAIYYKVYKNVISQKLLHSAEIEKRFKEV